MGHMAVFVLALEGKFNCAEAQQMLSRMPTAPPRVSRDPCMERSCASVCYTHVCAFQCALFSIQLNFNPTEGKNLQQL